MISIYLSRCALVSGWGDGANGGVHDIMFSRVILWIFRMESFQKMVGTENSEGRIAEQQVLSIRDGKSVIPSM